MNCLWAARCVWTGVYRWDVCTLACWGEDCRVGRSLRFLIASPSWHVPLFKIHWDGFHMSMLQAWKLAEKVGCVCWRRVGGVWSSIAGGSYWKKIKWLHIYSLMSLDFSIPPFAFLSTVHPAILETQSLSQSSTGFNIWNMGSHLPLLPQLYKSLRFASNPASSQKSSLTTLGSFFHLTSSPLLSTIPAFFWDPPFALHSFRSNRPHPTSGPHLVSPPKCCHILPTDNWLSPGCTWQAMWSETGQQQPRGECVSKLHKDSLSSPGVHLWGQDAQRALVLSCIKATLLFFF